GSTAVCTPFPYTTLFRSRCGHRPTGARPTGESARPGEDRGEHLPWGEPAAFADARVRRTGRGPGPRRGRADGAGQTARALPARLDRKSTRLNSSHVKISY